LTVYFAFDFLILSRFTCDCSIICCFILTYAHSANKLCVTPQDFQIEHIYMSNTVTLELIQAGSRVVVKEKSAMTGLVSPLEANGKRFLSLLTMGVSRGRNDQVF